MFRHAFPNMPGGKEVAPLFAVHLAAPDGAPACAADPTTTTIVETNGIRRGFVLTCIPCLELSEVAE